MCAAVYALKGSGPQCTEESLTRREIILKLANPMSGVFLNIDPHPPPSPPGECVPPAYGRGEDTLAGWRGGWGVNTISIFWKTPDALYSIYVSTLCFNPFPH